MLLTRPPEFVAARNALAKELRQRGDKPVAAAIAALRRPPWTDWALNVTAERHPDVVMAFVDAAAAMRDAQSAAVEGRTTDMSGSLRALRERTTVLAKRASSVLADNGRPGELAELVDRLGAIASDPAACDQLRAGLLRAGEPADDDVLAGLPAGAMPSQRSAAASPPAPAPASRRARPARTTEEVDVHRSVDRSDHDAAEQAAERRRLMRELADTERALRTSAHELVRVDRSLDDACTKQASAAAAVERASRELADADERRARFEERRGAVAAALADAERAADGLRRRLAEIAAHDAGG